MTLVTVVEARENLPELLHRAAAGEQIVITEDGKWLAALGAPPAPPTAEDEAQRRARAEEFERQIARWHAEDGIPYPPAGESPVFPRPESPAA
jgi:antitoxin (DNA-binding transcriptional repressor) of toxin-antitoxin stability system